MPKYELGGLELRGVEAFFYRWTHWIFRIILFGGAIAVVAFTAFSERRLIVFFVAIPIYLALVLAYQRLVLRMAKRVAACLVEHRRQGSAEQQQSVKDEAGTFASWSQQAKQRKREAPPAIEDIQVPYAERSFKVDWASLDLDDFPTFSPGEIEYDETLAEADLIDDTLLFDSTGHGVDLADDLFAGGLWIAFELLAMDESEWSMLPWGYEELFAIEVIAAAAGKPSQSRECGRLRTWAGRVSYQASPALVDEMLERIDRHLSAICEDPEARDVDPDSLDELEQQAYLMRQRIGSLRAR